MGFVFYHLANKAIKYIGKGIVQKNISFRAAPSGRSKDISSIRRGKKQTGYSETEKTDTANCKGYVRRSCQDYSRSVYVIIDDKVYGSVAHSFLKYGPIFKQARKR